MGGDAVTAPDRRAQEIEAWRLRARGKTYDQIAEEMGLPNRGVAHRLAARQLKRIEVELAGDENQRRRAIEAELIAVSEEAWAEWERSKQPRRTTKTVEGDEGSTETVEVREQTGTAAYLGLVRQTLVDRATLWCLTRTTGTQGEDDAAPVKMYLLPAETIRGGSQGAS